MKSCGCVGLVQEASARMWWFMPVAQDQHQSLCSALRHLMFHETHGPMALRMLLQLIRMPPQMTPSQISVT
jgi:hypothetical protein